jgi:hypothetical protein
MIKQKKKDGVAEVMKTSTKTVFQYVRMLRIVQKTKQLCQAVSVRVVWCHTGGDAAGLAGGPPLIFVVVLRHW